MRPFRRIFFTFMLATGSAYAADAGTPEPKTPAKAAEEAAAPKEEEDSTRVEPEAPTSENPLEVSDSVKNQIGSDADARSPGTRPGATGDVSRSYLPYYQETRGDYRLRTLPPFYLEHTRGLGTKDQNDEGLYGLLYYRRRSLKVDADVLFPLAWKVRDKDSHTLAIGPWGHRESNDENDNWFAPAFFQGKRKDGGYFHSPLLLTSSHWNNSGAFTLVGPYFRDRKGSDVDMGVAPFYFHGDNGDTDGARKTYSIIPPLLYYNRTREAEGSSLTVVGPVISESTPKRNIFDIAPLFFHIDGTPETGGIAESHTTLLPFFHYGKTPERSLFITPLFYHRTTLDSNTWITPLFSRAVARGGSTELIALGPGVPLFMNYRDKDTGLRWTGIFPLYFNETSPAGFKHATPLFAYSKNYGVSRDLWLFPTFTASTSVNGWSTNLHPLVYLGREKDAKHSVFAPIYWDFGNKGGRTTVAFPLFWRFSDYETGSITQLAVNSLYRERRVKGGTEWDVHLLPLLSYGQGPQSHFWNLLFGLAGYSRKGEYAYVRAFWIPIEVDSPKTNVARR